MWILRGHCAIAQDTTRATGNEAVLWIKRDDESAEPQHRVIAYVEGDVVVTADVPRGSSEAPQNRIQDATWLGHFVSTDRVTVQVDNPRPEPAVKPAIYRKALAPATAQIRRT